LNNTNVYFQTNGTLLVYVWSCVQVVQSNVAAILSGWNTGRRNRNTVLEMYNNCPFKRETLVSLICNLLAKLVHWCWWVGKLSWCG